MCATCGCMGNKKSAKKLFPKQTKATGASILKNKITGNDGKALKGKKKK